MRCCSTATLPEDDLYLWAQAEAALTCRARCTGGNPPSSERAALSHNRNQSPLREKRNSLHPRIHQRTTSLRYYFITYINATWVLTHTCDSLSYSHFTPIFSYRQLNSNKQESIAVPETETNESCSFHTSTYSRCWDVLRSHHQAIVSLHESRWSGHSEAPWVSNSNFKTLYKWSLSGKAALITCQTHVSLRPTPGQPRSPDWCPWHTSPGSLPGTGEGN